MNLPIEICAIIDKFLPYQCNVPLERVQDLRARKLGHYQGAKILDGFDGLECLSGLGIRAYSDFTFLIGWTRIHYRDFDKKRIEGWKTEITFANRNISIQDRFFSDKREGLNINLWISKVEMMMSDLCNDIAQTAISNNIKFGVLEGGDPSIDDGDYRENIHSCAQVLRLLR